MKASQRSQRLTAFGQKAGKCGALPNAAPLNSYFFLLNFSACAAAAPRSLTLQEAQQIALAEHPRIPWPALPRWRPGRPPRKFSPPFFPTFTAARQRLARRTRTTPASPRGRSTTPDLRSRSRGHHHQPAYHGFWAHHGVEPERQKFGRGPRR